MNKFLNIVSYINKTTNIFKIDMPHSVNHQYSSKSNQTCNYFLCDHQWEGHIFDILRDETSEEECQKNFYVISSFYISFLEVNCHSGIWGYLTFYIQQNNKQTSPTAHLKAILATSYRHVIFFWNQNPLRPFQVRFLLLYLFADKITAGNSVSPVPN